MDQHPITWAPPEPLWTDAIASLGNGRVSMQSPAILRFATDDFMQTFMNLLATDPQRLYKGLGWSSFDWDGPMAGIYTMTSPDGHHWTHSPEPIVHFHPRI